MSRATITLTLAFAGFLGGSVGFVAREALAPRPSSTGTVRAPSFADIVERVNPAVVQVATLERATRPRLIEIQGGERSPASRGDGAGFVVDSGGLILTNDHLVGRSSRIRVRLTDGREFAATLMGGDPSTDLALLRIEAGRLPAVALGDSDRLRVGDWVCAIGNPFRFEHSVTVGVVSSKGRKIFDASFDAFIQTDAAINPGNSGGPLLNAEGEAVGISAAVSRQGQGIGFAIPINVARGVLSELKSRGRVWRGYLGIELDNVDADLARFLGLPQPVGALVLDVISGQAGEAAGLRRYDVVKGVSGRAVDSVEGLIRTVSSTAPGTEVALDVIRDRRPIRLSARLGERKTAGQDEDHGVRPPPRTRPEARADTLGLVVLELGAEDRRALPAGRQGAMIDDVLSLSSGADDLDRGDLVVEVNRQATPDLGAYRRALQALAPDSVAWLYVYRPRTQQSFLAKLRADGVQERR